MWANLVLVVLATTGAEKTPPDDGGAVISGTVLDALSATVAGADVRLTRLDRDLGPLSYSATRATLSAEDGAFRFERVTPSTWLLDARDETRYLIAPLRIVVTKETIEIDEIDLQLVAAAAIEGIVTDENGVPIPGVGVAVGDGGLQGKSITPVTMIDYATGERMSLGDDTSYPRLPLKMSITDSAGRFKLAPVLPEVATSIRVGGIAAYHDTTVSSVFAPAGGVAFVEVALARGAAITGRVLREDGRPVEDSQVSLLLLEAQPTLDAWIVLPRTSATAGITASRGLTTGKEGLFRFEGLDAGRYLVVAEAEGFARTTSTILAMTKHGEVLPVELTLTEGFAIRGQINDPDRFGRANVVIEAVVVNDSKRGAESFLAPLRTTPRTDGSFEIRLSAPEAVDLRVSCPGIPTLHLKALDPTATEPVVLLRTRHDLEPRFPAPTALATTPSRW